MPARSYCGPVHLWLWVGNCQSYNVNCYALQVVATVARHVQCSLLCFVSVIVFYIYSTSNLPCDVGQEVCTFLIEILRLWRGGGERTRVGGRQREPPVAALPSPPHSRDKRWACLLPTTATVTVCSDAHTVVFACCQRRHGVLHLWQDIFKLVWKSLKWYYRHVSEDDDDDGEGNESLSPVAYFLVYRE